MENQEKTTTIKTTTLKTTGSIRHDHLFKVVVLGDAKVGKTSLVAAFTG
jgi:GTPase SAR1 family protein